MPRVNPDDVSDLRSRLRFMWQFLSWRQIKEEFYPSVPAGTLCTIAKGGNIPRKHWRALGLLEPDEETKHKRRFKRTFTRLLKELRA